MNFFPDVPPPAGPDDEPEELPQPAWLGAPEDALPGVVPVEMLLGRSPSTVVMLTGMRAFPTGLAMTLGVRVRGPLGRRDLNSEVFDGPYSHDMDEQWQARRLKWGFELADGTRVTNVDPPAWSAHAEPPHHFDPMQEPDRPMLTGGGGGGGVRSVDREYWLWPLPPAGALRVACEWLDHGIDLSIQELDAGPLREAAARARPLWPAG